MEKDMSSEKFETGKEQINIDHKGEKKIITLLFSLIVLLLITILILFFLLKDADSGRMNRIILPLTKKLKKILKYKIRKI